MAGAADNAGGSNGVMPNVEESIQDVLASAKAFLGHAETVPGADVALLEKMVAKLAESLFSTNNVARDALQKVQAWETSLRQREDDLARRSSALRRKEDQLAQENGVARPEKDEALTPLAGSAPDCHLFSRPLSASPDFVRQSSERYSPPMDGLDGEPRLFAPHVVQRVESSSEPMRAEEGVSAGSPAPAQGSDRRRTPKKNATVTFPHARSVSTAREASGGRLASSSRSVTVNAGAVISPKLRVGRTAHVPPPPLPAAHGFRHRARSISAGPPGRGLPTEAAGSGGHPPTTRDVRREVSLTSVPGGAAAQQQLPSKKRAAHPSRHFSVNVGRSPHHMKRASPGRLDDQRTAEAPADPPVNVSPSAPGAAG
ncbi:hypothetical protein DIPPA_26902 [Diplonema papillatum]|nr:hypothetical protein DIPPA_26902 [Diplonema papillatum]